MFKTPDPSVKATKPIEMKTLSPTKKSKETLSPETDHKQIIENIYGIISVLIAMDADVNQVQTNIRDVATEDIKAFKEKLMQQVMSSKQYPLQLNEISQLLYYGPGSKPEKQKVLSEVISAKKAALQAELEKLLGVISAQKNNAAADADKQTGVKYKTFMDAYYMHQITREDLTVESEGGEHASQQRKYALIAWYELNKKLLEVTIKTENIEETDLWHYISSIATEFSGSITKGEIILRMKECLQNGTIEEALETMTQRPFSLFDTLFPKNNHQSKAQSTPATPEASSATENRVEFPQTPEAPFLNFIGTPAGERQEKNGTSPTTQPVRSVQLETLDECNESPNQEGSSLELGLLDTFKTGNSGQLTATRKGSLNDPELDGGDLQVLKGIRTESEIKFASEQVMLSDGSLQSRFVLAVSTSEAGIDTAFTHMFASETIHSFEEHLRPTNKSALLEHQSISDKLARSQLELKELKDTTLEEKQQSSINEAEKQAAKAMELAEESNSQLIKVQQQLTVTQRELEEAKREKAEANQAASKEKAEAQLALAKQETAAVKVALENAKKEASQAISAAKENTAAKPNTSEAKQNNPWKFFEDKQVQTGLACAAATALLLSFRK